MNRFKVFILSLVFSVLFVSRPAGALDHSLEFIPAGNIEKIGTQSFTGGAAVRLRYLLGGKFAFLLHANVNGNWLYTDVVAGGNIRLGDSFFFDGGGGVRYSKLWGMGLAVHLGVGYRFHDKWYVSFPVIYKVGFSIEYIPYIGYRF